MVSLRVAYEHACTLAQLYWTGTVRAHGDPRWQDHEAVARTGIRLGRAQVHACRDLTKWRAETKRGGARPQVREPRTDQDFAALGLGRQDVLQASVDAIGATLGSLVDRMAGLERNTGKMVVEVSTRPPYGARTVLIF